MKLEEVNTIFSQGGAVLSYNFKEDIVLGGEEDFYVLLIHPLG